MQAICSLLIFYSDKIPSRTQPLKRAGLMNLLEHGWRGDRVKILKFHTLLVGARYPSEQVPIPG